MCDEVVIGMFIVWDLGGVRVGMMVIVGCGLCDVFG